MNRIQRLTIVSFALFLTACFSETFDARYASFPVASEAGAVGAGWVPGWLPVEALDIKEVHNIDTNARMLSFEMPKGTNVKLPSACVPTNSDATPKQPFARPWWPADVPESNSTNSAHQYWLCGQEYVALLATGTTAVVWAIP